MLSVGLAVDYSCHVGHSFMHQYGTRQERVNKALREIGVSVINGAISTFLAVCLLAFSKSYVFTVFTKMFALYVHPLAFVCRSPFVLTRTHNWDVRDLSRSCSMGAGHGLILLPVVLSLVGPKPHKPVAEAEHGDGAAKPAAAGDAAAAPKGVEMTTAVQSV